MKLIGNKLDAKVFNNIAIVLAGSISNWCGKQVLLDIYQIPQVRLFAHSFIARYLVTGSGLEPQYVLVKIAHKANETNLQAALKNDSLRILAHNEMNQLQATWQAFQKLGNPDLFAVQPLAYLEPWNAIVMLAVKAQSLRTQLVSPQLAFSQPKASAQFIQHLRKASQWLRYYHNHVGGSLIGPASNTLMQARLDKVGRDVENHLGNRFNASKHLSAIKARMDSASGIELVSQQHGDFHCSNILVSAQGQICVLDPRADTSRKSVYNDLATLLIDLYLKPIPMLTGRRFAQKFLEESQQAIVESYFKPGEYSQSLLNFYCACEGIFKWSMYESGFVRRKKIRTLAPLIRPVLTRYMRDLIHQFISVDT